MNNIKTKEAWDNATKNIRPCSIVLVWGNCWISRIIQWYQRWEAKDKQTGPSHAEVYWGSGKNMVVSAEWNGVRKMSFDRHFGKKPRVEVYHYKDLSVENMHVAKMYNMGSVGRNYDYIGLISFLSNLRIIYRILGRKITPTSYADFCSENVADTFGKINIKTSKKIKSKKTTPDDIYRYISNSTKWEKSFEYQINEE